jgi:20S proteasome alpha/beta subunit
VTIVAGFKCINGVLLGADMRIEDGTFKYPENKIFEIGDSGGFGIAFAGAGDFSSISACADLMGSSDIASCAQTIESLKESIRTFIETRRYRELITVKGSAAYTFEAIIGLRSLDGRTDLLYLYGPTLYPIVKYRCIGAGFGTATLLAKWLYESDYDMKSFVPLALSIFRACKDHNQGCDDPTRIVRLYDGPRSIDDPLHALWDDSQFMWGIGEFLRPVIRGYVDQKTTDADFDFALNSLNSKLRSIRDGAKRSWLPIAPEVKSSLERTIAELQHQRPSRE